MLRHIVSSGLRAILKIVRVRAFHPGIGSTRFPLNLAGCNGEAQLRDLRSSSYG